jgi:hypothetical protein
VRIKSLRNVPTAVLSLITSPHRTSDGTSTDTTDLAENPDYRPIRPNPGLTEKGLDFGTLTKVTSENGVVTLHVRGFRIATEESTFILDPQASLQGEDGLRNNPSPRVTRQTLTQAEFVRNAARLATEQRSPMVWLRHGGPDGHVTALAEQYVPIRSAEQDRKVS